MSTKLVHFFISSVSFQCLYVCELWIENRKWSCDEENLAKWKQTFLALNNIRYVWFFHLFYQHLGRRIHALCSIGKKYYLFTARFFFRLDVWFVHSLLPYVHVSCYFPVTPFHSRRTFKVYQNKPSHTAWAIVIMLNFDRPAKFKQGNIRMLFILHDSFSTNRKILFTFRLNI